MWYYLTCIHARYVHVLCLERKQKPISSWCLSWLWYLWLSGHASAAFLDKFWIIGGQTLQYTTRQVITTRRSDVWSSHDGVNWTPEIDEAPFRRRYGHSLTTYRLEKGGHAPALILMGGYTPTLSNDIWYSLDGSMVMMMIIIETEEC